MSRLKPVDRGCGPAVVLEQQAQVGWASCLMSDGGILGVTNRADRLHCGGQICRPGEESAASYCMALVKFQILMVMLQAPLSQEVPNERRSDSPT
ncbi:hypothetical protein HCEG_09050 [Histoplasma capsulatum var. duboisii H88]|uniref:Uncharacterized protein n=2 Tax=Ajellomyces capsulatus TaxID=5037 RepID=F0UVA8_AJEC8|nr:hypothetical protein HCDG_01942 [Histoplasma capsulatum H143]EGC49835.1 hypothetical protein HCEG_09050 [Histoplasma capsulatum var. duboisii H88]